jgi:hypothetical protein
MMGIFLNVLMYAFALLPSVVTGVESLVGDSASGATKKQMATDALSAALSGASSVTTGTDAALSQLAATAVEMAPVNNTRSTGAYQAATAAAKVTAAAASAVSQAAPAAQSSTSTSTTPTNE